MSGQDRNPVAVAAARVGALMIVASMGACVSGYGAAGVFLLVLGFVIAVAGWLGGGAS